MKKLARNGIALAFDEAGKGGPPVLLIHGWACDHRDMEPLFRHFSTSHRTISVDLRGHGESDKPLQDYSIGEFTNDLAWLCNCLNIWKPIVIGHSLGGLVSMELAFDYKIPLAIAVLDSPLIPTEGRRAALSALLDELRGPDYADRQREFIAGQLFVDPNDNPRKTDIIRRISASPQHVTVSVFENILKWNRMGEILSCRLPLAYIGAARPVTDLARLDEAGSNWLTWQNPGAGHFFQLEEPDEVNAAIDRFLTTSVLS